MKRDPLISSHWLHKRHLTLWFLSRSAATQVSVTSVHSLSHVRLCVTHRWQPTRLPCPWDSPGKNTGVGCHFLLQYMKVESESEVAQSCPTFSNPMDCSLPGSSIHGIFQARVLEWVAIAMLWGHSINQKVYLGKNWSLPTVVNYPTCLASNFLAMWVSHLGYEFFN